MPNQRIKIIGIKPSGELKHSDGGRTHVNSTWLFRKVIWKIDHDPVGSFLIVAKTAHYPFKDPLPTTFGTKVKLKVKKGEHIDWEYVINWKDKDGKVTEFDPIIAINPTYPSINFFSIISAVAAFLLISLFFWKKKK